MEIFTNIAAALKLSEFIAFDTHIIFVTLNCVSLWLILLGLLRTNSLIESVIYSSTFSILVCLLYLLLDAPDVAMTEAAIGVCLSTVIYLLMLKKIPYKTSFNKLVADKLSSDQSSINSKLYKNQTTNYLSILIILALIYYLLQIGNNLPNYGLAETPINEYQVSQHYITHTKEQIGIDAIVAAILASYRGFDTLGETLVIFTAGIIVTLILSYNKNPISAGQTFTELQNQPILRLTTNLIVPYIVFYALYIQINGEASPGGGFQAGALFASAIVAINIVFGKTYLSIFVDEHQLIRLAALGVAIYAITGLSCLIFGANYLNYYALPINSIYKQALGIAIVEIGVGLCVASTLTLLYYKFLDSSSNNS